MLNDIFRSIFRRKSKLEKPSPIYMFDNCPRCGRPFYLDDGRGGVVLTHSAEITNLFISLSRMSMGIRRLTPIYESFPKAIERSNYEPAILRMKTMLVQFDSEIRKLREMEGLLRQDIKDLCTKAPINSGGL